MRFSLGLPFILACLAPVACTISTQGQVESASDVQPTPYYYGGPHFYPDALGGEWCPITEPHAHDFPPDHPDYYAYDNGYYYYSGRPNEVYVMGTVPIGVRVHVVHEREPHAAYALPAQAPPAPHLATGRWPTREAHPAPLRPPPPQVAGSRRIEPRAANDGRYVDQHRVEEPHPMDDHRQDRRIEAKPEEHVDPHHDDNHMEKGRIDQRADEQNRSVGRPEMQHAPQAQPPQPAQARPAPPPVEAHRAPPNTNKRRKDEKK
jgi:hypothetical protein